jgi:hypothetical protein
MSCAAWLLDTARPRMGGICYSSSMNRILGNSSKGGKHPVSGNRGFGIKDSGDDIWTFYPKAVDRETPFWKNTFARKAGKNVFCLGHGFWRLSYGGMKDYLTEILQMNPKPASMFAFPRPSCKTDARC